MNGTKNPTRLLIMHRRGSAIAGYEWDEPDRWYEARKYPNFHKFEGKTVTFLAVSNDETITSEEALNFCKLVHGGAIRWLNVDLSGIGK